jgi:hypothetical protein
LTYIEIIIPFIILELKKGDKKRKRVTSDSIRTRNESGRKLKNIFPFCKFYFIAECTTKKPETVYKHQTSFDEFFLFYNVITDKEIKDILNRFIIPDLDNLKNKNIL